MARTAPAETKICAKCGVVFARKPIWSRKTFAARQCCAFACAAALRAGATYPNRKKAARGSIAKRYATAMARAAAPQGVVSVVDVAEIRLLATQGMPRTAIAAQLRLRNRDVATALEGSLA